MCRSHEKNKEIMRLVWAPSLRAAAASPVVRNQSERRRREAGFMIFPCCAEPLRREESAADTSPRIQNKY